MKQILCEKISVLCLVLLLLDVSTAYAQKDTLIEDYNRSSICTFTLIHYVQKFADEIIQTVRTMDSPERYNEHNLSLRMLMAPLSTTEDVVGDISSFLKKNQVAKRLVSKWFSRNKSDGSFNMKLVSDRGNYGASFDDVEFAHMSIRDLSLLDDAGEELIGNTFVLVNDISYIDKEAKAEQVAAVFSIIGTTIAQAGALTAGVMQMSGASDVSSDAVFAASGLLASTSYLGAGIADAIAGFRVNIHSYLYRLKWNDEIAAKFYTDYYFDAEHPDPEKKTAYERDRETFQVEYVGDYEANSSKTVARGIRNKEQVFLKVLTRAIDENIVELRKQHPVINLTATIYDQKEDKVYVKIGKKEGITPNSTFEVLERVYNRDGEISYKKKGVIKPQNKWIWDNRFMAYEENADNSGLNYTIFDIVSGGDFYPGMLIREIK